MLIIVYFIIPVGGKVQFCLIIFFSEFKFRWSVKKFKTTYQTWKCTYVQFFFFFFVKHQKSFVMEAYLCSKFNLFDGARITWCVLVHIGVLIKSINYALQNLEEWMSSKKVFLNLSLFFKKKNSHFSFIKNVLYYKLGLIHWYLIGHAASNCTSLICRNCARASWPCPHNLILEFTLWRENLIHVQYQIRKKIIKKRYSSIKFFNNLVAN